MNKIINLFETQNKKVINLTSKINYIYQIEHNINKILQDDKFNNICFILEIHKLKDKIKQYIFNHYKINEIEYINNSCFIIYYKNNYLYSCLYNNELNDKDIKYFIDSTDFKIENNI